MRQTAKKILPALAFGLLFYCLASCGGKKEAAAEGNDKTELSAGQMPTAEERLATAAAALQPVDLPPGVGRRIRVANIGALGTVFNDSNHQQLDMARKYGISPITDLRSAYFTGRPLVKVSDTEYYRIDSLTHSLPYLVPEAAELLSLIGKNFKDSLEARGGDSHLIKVTSMLRTPETVGKLRRVNVNATDSSTHQYATTFDISYTNFYVADSTRLVYQGDLKNLLAEILLELRDQGKCLVKYERKTGCFHITVAG